VSAALRRWRFAAFLPEEMARDEKRIELRPVDDSPPVLEATVHRLESDSSRLRVQPVRVENKREAPQVSQRLNLPDKDVVETRTYQPGIEVLIETDTANPDQYEEDWGKASAEQKHIPWGWFALIAILLAVALTWSLSQVRDATTQVEQLKVETATVLKNDAEEELEAAQLVDRIDSAVRGFFRAKSIDGMVSFVRQPERVRPLMEIHYSKTPLVSHTVLNMRRLNPLTLDQRGEFWVASVELDNHETKNLVMEVPEGGAAKIDWETLVCYQPMEWDTFATERPSDTSLEFRVHVQEDHFYSHEFADSSKWACFRLTTLGSKETVFGYAKANGDIARALHDLLARNRGAAFSVIVRLSIPAGLQSRSGVVIEKLMNPRWIYLDLPDTGS
jgi:hypothetical protein